MSVAVSRKSLILYSLLAGPITLFFINAPFGRFAPASGSIFLLDGEGKHNLCYKKTERILNDALLGIKAWITMELFSPSLFIFAYLTSPLSASASPIVLTHPSTLLATLFIIHYINRSLLSPLRTPSRSKSHLIVPLAGILFNFLNGFSMGAYLSSPSARAFLEDAYRRPTFYVGLGLWTLGFAGNIIHDEILLNIRRKANSKGKKHDGAKTQNNRSTEHYAIPQGLLYEYISYPNYFCEWMEWAGFALAAAPPPTLSDVIQAMSSLSFGSLLTSAFPLAITPPFIFFVAEVILMLPRAYHGHKWYLQNFPEYPKNRRIVLPFVW